MRHFWPDLGVGSMCVSQAEPLPGSARGKFHLQMVDPFPSYLCTMGLLESPVKSTPSQWVLDQALWIWRPDTGHMPTESNGCLVQAEAAKFNPRRQESKLVSLSTSVKRMYLWWTNAYARVSRFCYTRVAAYRWTSFDKVNKTYL